MRFEIGTHLGPYEILSPIGAGGMGEVWKARDTRLGRIVAIKKVREQHSERFKQEARTIAALNHPYICQLFDIGSDYLVLEYVEGKSLPCPLPEREAVRLAIQIATALEEAHRKGIIHRDLKPSNIMLTDKGSVKLLDFGLAKLYEQNASSSPSSTVTFPLTQTGAVVGTVSYMSPEQAQGQPADARSDIFSFGLVLYEMLSGRRAFPGDSNYTIMNAIVKEAPPPLQASASLEKIVRRCLAKQPSGRFQTMSEVKTALEQVFADKASPSAAQPQPSIAVLPFVNMSGDKEQEYFSDGLAEEIINALTQIPRLKVTARTSSFFFRGKEADVREIGARLNVESVLEGSVRKAGNRIRVTAQLVKVADGYHLWSERYDREMTDVFAVQDEICQTIVDKLRIKLVAGRPLVKRYTENLEAYNLCLKARHYLLKWTAENLEKSRQFYEQAIALDPDYSLAYVRMAEYYWWSTFFGLLDPEKGLPKAKSAALDAIKLDDTLAEAHGLLGTTLGFYDFNWTGAEIEFRRALDLNPSSPDSDLWYSLFLDANGRVEEATTEAKRALEQDPLSPSFNAHLGYQYYCLHQTDLAIAQLQYAIELEPNNYVAYNHLAISLLQKGRLAEATAAMEKSAELSGRNSLILGFLGYFYALAGRHAEARQFLEELKARRETSYVSAQAIGALYVGLGEPELYWEYFEQAIDGRDILFIYLLKSDPVFDPLRCDPRYHVLLRKMNLEQ